MTDGLDRAVLDGVVATTTLGRPARFEATCGSTNDVALDLADGGAPHGALVVADAQTAGRGRRGHAWHSPAGKALYASLVLRPEPNAATPTLLVAAIGLGLAEGLDAAAGVPVGIKWPNDLWMRGRKVAGILVEARGFDAARPVLVAGFGVNVSQAPDDFPEAFRGSATSVSMEMGAAPPRAALLADLLRALEPRIEEACGRAPGGDLASAYRDRSVLLGHEVELLDGDRPVSGTVADLSATEGLLLRTASGAHVHVRAEHAREVRPVSGTG